jgi:hypothetical protein
MCTTYKEIRMIRFFRLPLVAAIAATVSLGAHATITDVSTNNWYEFTVDTLTSTSGGTEWIDYTNGSALNFNFTINAGYVGSLTVVDTGFAGDTFNVFNGTTLLGNTSTVPVVAYDPLLQGITNADAALADSSFSRGTFVLGAGTYSINGALLQSVLDAPGGAPLNATIGDLRLTVAAVPEPEAFALLLAGLGLVGFVTRRRKLAGNPTRSTLISA